MGETHLVLTGQIFDSDEAISTHLEIIYGAIRFYIGSFENIYQVNKKCFS